MKYPVKFRAVLFLAVISGSNCCNLLHAATDEFVKGKVIGIGKETVSRHAKINEIRFLILSGRFKGETVEVRNFLWDDGAYNTVLDEGRCAVLKIRSKDNKIQNAVIKGYYRQNYILLFLGLFFAFMFLVTGRRVLRISLSMLINAAGFLFILIPLFKKGINPLIAAFIFSVLSIVITLILITGLNIKSASAAAGCAASVVAAALIAVIFQRFAHITGFFMPGARLIITMLRSGSNPEINFFLVGVSAVLIAALGMAIDVAVSISSFITELHDENRDITFERLFKSGVSVGSDILSTMVNSLIFVFLGTSLPLVLNCLICNIAPVRFLNYEFVSALIIQAILASSVLVLTIPITSLCAAYMVKKNDL